MSSCLCRTLSRAVATGWEGTEWLLAARMAEIWLATCSISALKVEADSRKALWPRMMSYLVLSEVAIHTWWRLPTS